MATAKPKPHMRLIASTEMYFLNGFLSSFPALVPMVQQPDKSVQVSLMPPEPDEFIRVAVDLWLEPVEEQPAQLLRNFSVTMKVPQLLEGVPVNSLRAVEVFNNSDRDAQGKIKLAQMNIDVSLAPLAAGRHVASLVLDWLVTNQMPDAGAWVSEGDGLQKVH